MENLEMILEKIEKLEKKIDEKPEQKLIKRSESIIEIAKALSNFQAEVKNPLNSTENSFFKNKYATLGDVLNEVRPVLAKHGLSFIQIPSGDGNLVVLTTLLMHESGEWIEPDPIIMRPEKQNAQGMGSVISYSRRYSLSSILGVASEDDDDGNEASQTGKKPSTPTPKTTTKSKGKDELKELTAELVEKAKTLQTGGINNADIMKVFSEKGCPNPNQIKDIKLGKEIMTELNKLG